MGTKALKLARWVSDLTVDEATNTATYDGAFNTPTATALQTPRTLTIGLTSKQFDGTADVAWSLSEIGVDSDLSSSSTDFDTDFSGKDTDNLSEGVSNLYFTEARARNSISVTGDLTYNATTGVLGVDVPKAYDSSDFDTDFGTKTTDNLGEGTTNLYFTTARVDSHLSGGTGVTYTAGEISIGQPVATTDNVQFNDLVVAGNLTVQGTQTVFETAILQVEDQNIELGKVATPTNATANTGGITVLAGADVDKTWNWLSATASWTSSEHIDVASGKDYKINGTTVLNNNTLGSAVVSSSLTSVGTLNGGSISSGFGNIDIGSSIFTGNGSGLTDVDAATLNSQNGAHYLDYNNFTNTPANLSDFNNDGSFISLTDLSASGDLSYNSSTGVFSVTTYKSTDFDTDFGTKTTDNLGEGTTNLYFTTARVDSHLSGGTGVTYTAGQISIGQAVATNSDVQFNDLVVAGNLTVQGTQTVLETATLQVEDQNIELGKVATPTNATANTGGITILAGTDVDKTWNWLSATASWTSSEHIDVASSKEYKINGTKVLDSTSLGSAVVSSSLTSVGILNSGSISSGFGNINIGSSTFTGNGSGLTNVAAATATSLQTARTINGTSFDGTANITVPGNFADRTTDESGHAVFIGTTATGNQSMFTNTNYRFNPSTGQLSATDFNSTSDATLKDNVIDIENALNLVSQMRGVRYTWKDNGIAGVGVIAQEIEQVLPEVVSDNGDHKSVSYGNVVGVLIEAIKELKAEVEELKKYK